MAKIRKQVLGRISGAVGDVLFRVKDGKGFVGTRPNSFMPGTDAKAVARRRRFALSVRYAKSVNEIASLKSIWKQYKSSSQSAYNFIMRSNYHAILPDDVTLAASLVPDIGFSTDITSSTIEPPAITVTIDPIGFNSGIDPLVETKIQLATVLFFKSPIDGNYSLYRFLPLLSPEVALSLNTALNFSIPLSDQQEKLYDQYTEFKAFFAFFTLDLTKKVIHFSNTYTNPAP